MRQTHLFLFVALLAFWTVLSSSISGKYGIYAGGGHGAVMGEDLTSGPYSTGNNCASCHNGASGNAFITARLDTDDTTNVTYYVPGDTMILRLSVNYSGSMPNPVYGIQAFMYQISNMDTIGIFTGPNTPNTQITLLNNRQYVEHLFPSASNVFEVEWIADSALTGHIQVNYSGVAGNGNGQPDFDYGFISGAQSFVPYPATFIEYSQDTFCNTANNEVPTITGYPEGVFYSSNGLDLDSTTGEIDFGNSAPGTYTVSFDHLEYESTTQVTIGGPDQVFEQASICEGDSLFLEQNWQKEAGIYLDAYTNVYGCDSIVETTLTVNLHDENRFEAEICKGDSLLFRGTYYSEEDIYTDTLQNAAGCDSLIVFNLQVFEADSGIVQIDSSLMSANNALTYQWKNCDTGEEIPGANAQIYDLIENGNFYVVIGNGECLDSTDCFEVRNLSISSQPADDFFVTWHPKLKSITVESTKNTAYKMSLVNTLGKILITKNCVGLNIISTESLSRGQYWIIIESDNARHVKRINLN